MLERRQVCCLLCSSALRAVRVRSLAEAGGFQFDKGSSDVSRYSPGVSDDSSLDLINGGYQMLRMGKNPNEEKSPAQPDANRSYSPYQNGETYARPATENAATPKALTDSESIAREIKDGTLSGFVGSGTSITGEATFK